MKLETLLVRGIKCLRENGFAYTLGKVTERILCRPASNSDGKWREGRFDLETNNWGYRIEKLVSYLDSPEISPRVRSIMDLGSGGQHLRKYLKADMVYYPVDYIDRPSLPPVFIADFNKREFPEQKVDAIFMSGILEYIEDPENFLANVCKWSDIVLLAYNANGGERSISERESRGWCCHLSTDEILAIFNTYKFRSIVCEHYVVDGVSLETYYVFKREMEADD